MLHGVSVGLKKKNSKTRVSAFLAHTVAKKTHNLDGKSLIFTKLLRKIGNFVEKLYHSCR
ncbi:MAG: hypothetical protein CMK57_03970 [Proteobacteria bacterium]|nr:hypothetical protein [Pseudomonadota bacterium]